MNVVHAEALPRRDVEAAGHSIDFHVPVNVTAFVEYLLHLGNVSFALLDVLWVFQRPAFQAVGFTNLLAGVTALE